MYSRKYTLYLQLPTTMGRITTRDSFYIFTCWVCIHMSLLTLQFQIFGSVFGKRFACFSHKHFHPATWEWIYSYDMRWLVFDKRQKNEKHLVPLLQWRRQNKEAQVYDFYIDISVPCQKCPHRILCNLLLHTSTPFPGYHRCARNDTQFNISLIKCSCNNKKLYAVCTENVILAWDLRRLSRFKLNAPFICNRYQ